MQRRRRRRQRRFWRQRKLQHGAKLWFVYSIVTHSVTHTRQTRSVLFDGTGGIRHWGGSDPQGSPDLVKTPVISEMIGPDPVGQSKLMGPHYTQQGSHLVTFTCFIILYSHAVGPVGLIRHRLCISPETVQSLIQAACDDLHVNHVTGLCSGFTPVAQSNAFLPEGPTCVALAQTHKGRTYTPTHLLLC